jgi:hypothetical protein
VSRLLILAACTFWMAVACSDDEPDLMPFSPVPIPGTEGTLEYDWTINGRRVEADCEAIGALLFEAVIIDQGFRVGDVVAPCEDFHASVELYADDFVSRSALTDNLGDLAVGRIIEDRFSIADGLVTTLLADFTNAPVPMEPPPPDAGVPSSPDGGAAEVPPPEPVAEADAGTDAGLP